MRALLFCACGEGTSIIRGYLKSADTDRMIRALSLFGAEFKELQRELVIEGTGGKWRGADDVIDVGNSGIMLRFLAAVAVNAPGYTVMTGDSSIRSQRSMQEVLSGLSQMGATAISTRGNGLAPVFFKGPLVGREAKINGADSQPVSCLMIAAALRGGKCRINVDEMGEVPWVKLTALWLEKAGAEVVLDSQGISISMESPFCPFQYQIGGDVSSAAFPAAAALISGSEIELKGIIQGDGQGDIRFFQLIEQMGAKILWSPCGTSLRVSPGQLKGIEADINDCIDAIAALSAIACYAEGKTVIRNAKAARSKECDRIRALSIELKKMGARVTALDDGLIIEGGSMRGAEVFSHHDHRMALALIAAGLGAQGETVIADTCCIEKTYPSFPDDMRSIGADVDRLL